MNTQEVHIRPARIEDLQSIMLLEEATFGRDMGQAGMASEVMMAARIRLVNSGDSAWFWVAEAGGRIAGYVLLQPTHISPEACQSWAMATDSGALIRTFDPSGEYLYGVSLAIAEDAPAATAEFLMQELHALRILRAKRIFFICGRMPEWKRANRATGVSPDRYWSLRDDKGALVDPLLRYFEEVVGVAPERLLPEGFLPDADSGGHGVLCVSRNPERDIAFVAKRLYEKLAAAKLEVTPRLLDLQGGERLWWDLDEDGMVSAETFYLAQGCPDWGERGGKRNELCAFCALPEAARRYLDHHYPQGIIPEEHARLFIRNLACLVPPERPLHTLMVFNAGSFLAEAANHVANQIAITAAVAAHPRIARFVIESRAALITEASIKRLTDLLYAAGKQLTVRIGVETQDDHLRNRVLRKGHSREQLARAAAVLRQMGVRSGGYALLNPAPGLDRAWAIEEAKATLRFILDPPPNGLAMDEVYFGSANVASGTPLAASWRAGEFQPATLSAVLEVIRYAAEHYGKRVHLLPFKDEPPFLAVPSNHVAGGIPESLEGATGCDAAFHEMLDHYRRTMNKTLLVAPNCSCHN